MSISRVQAGVPAGGQFAASAHAEADVSLDTFDGASLEALADAYLDLDAREVDEAERAALGDTIRQAYDSAHHWANRRGTSERSRGVVEVDDIAQEAMLAVLEARANGRTVDDTKAYIHRTAWAVAQTAGNAAVRAEDRRALSMFSKAAEAKAVELGRALTSAEQDAIATSIRENWHDPRRKPSVNFRQYSGQREISMNAAETAEAADLLLPSVTMPETGDRGVNDVTPDSYMDRALDAVDEHRPGTLRDARRMLYNALAETADAPLVQGGTLSQRRVTACHSTMGAHPGGVAAALRDWENGETNQATEALFAPWGENATEDDREAVAGLMRRFPDRAEDLWDSALKLANNRNAERV